VSGISRPVDREETNMELTQSAARSGVNTATHVARQALEIVVGVLLVDREPVASKYEDLFHMPW
jgi:hypothetical protein